MVWGEKLYIIFLKFLSRWTLWPMWKCVTKCIFYSSLLSLIWLDIKIISLTMAINTLFSYNNHNYILILVWREKLYIIFLKILPRWTLWLRWKCVIKYIFCSSVLSFIWLDIEIISLTMVINTLCSYINHKYILV